MSHDPVRCLRLTADSDAASLPKFTKVHAIRVLNGATTATASVKLYDAVNLRKLTASQTHTSYDGNPATEGSFDGGTGYAATDTIRLSDDSLITVDAVADGVVTEFTVTTAGYKGAASNVVLTQLSTSGAGTGFTLTPLADNLTLTGRTPVAEVHCEEVTDGTASLFQTQESSVFRVPLGFDFGVCADLTGSNAVAYIYYS